MRTGSGFQEDNRLLTTAGYLSDRPPVYSVPHSVSQIKKLSVIDRLHFSETCDMGKPWVCHFRVTANPGPWNSKVIVNSRV